MTPKRFKAVCTETGREFGTDYLAPEATYFKNGNIVQRYWLEFLGDADAEPKKIELCQSTGENDLVGKEIFFGDVVIIACTCCAIKDIFYVDFKRGRIVYIPVLAGDAKTGHFNKITVIGNRWQPHEQLQEAAEKLAK